MRFMVGLGTPGKKSEKPRHNLGYIVLDALLEKLEPLDKTFWENNRNLKTQIKQIKYKDDTLLLVKPATFMNNSGFSVSKVLNFYKIDPKDLYLIHDELDLPFGKIRVRFGGGAGGNHGVESVIEHIGDKFLRIRLGIGTDSNHETRREHTDRYVLGNISSGERGTVKNIRSAQPNRGKNTR